MPWFINRTLFHDRKDMEQIFCFTGLREELLDMVIFAESTEFTDEFDFNAIFIGNTLCILVDLFRKGL